MRDTIAAELEWSLGHQPTAHDFLITAIEALDLAVTAVHREHGPFSPVRCDVDDALELLHKARRNVKGN